MKRILGALLALALLPAHADERILSYDSEITVHAGGSQTVAETIRARAEGARIKRGIYRDFPTTYRTASGTRHRVDFRVVAVARDGQPEPFHTERLGNGVRVYVGRADVFLAPGEYTWRIEYVTDRQLGHFASHDELYWNVTGNGWDFPIDAVTARVHLPPGVPAERVTAEAYTGPQGARGQAYRSETRDGGAAFATTAGLAAGEGLTIVVGWPKGHVREPTWEDRLRYRWRDERALIVLWGGVLALLLYYGFAWWRVGRDPAAGVIVPEYEAPAGYPPAALRLVRRMGWDDKTLSAALVGLAVKGALTITEDDDEYRVQATGKATTALGADEQAILGALGSGALEFKSSNHAEVSALRKAHRAALQQQYERSHFYSNRGWLVPGWVLTVAIVGFAAAGLVDSFGFEAFFTLFMAVFVAAFGAPFFTALWRLRDGAARTPRAWLRLVASAVPLGFLVVFFGGALPEMGGAISVPMLAGVVAIALLNAVFAHLVKAPTREGRKLLDRAEGFRQYLGIAESDELKFKYARPVTPERFEAFLPYAIALDVETQWAERFAASLRASGQQPSGYRTSWYHGNSFSGVRGLSTSLGAGLAATVSSSSHAPGSSSGGGGGGSSGGGGGGGGGGGW